MFRNRKGISASTIRNEIATINNCMRYLSEHIEALSDISAFKIPKITSRKIDASGEEVRRQTFISEEWDVAYKRRVVSVAVSMKKKVAVDSIKSV